MLAAQWGTAKLRDGTYCFYLNFGGEQTFGSPRDTEEEAIREMAIVKLEVDTILASLGYALGEMSNN